MKNEQAELLDSIITPETALEMANDNSLVVVVDNHKPSFTEEPELLELIER